MALTDQQALTRWKECLDALALRKSYTIGGRTYTSADEAEVRKTIEWYERRIQRSQDETGGFGLASFGEPS